MKSLTDAQKINLEMEFSNPTNFRPSDGGHMSYHRFLFDDIEGNTYFTKAHDPTLFEQDWREKEMRGFLDKEGRIYQHLGEYSYPHIPVYSNFSDDMLVLNGLLTSQGWHWRAPKNEILYGNYVEDILGALKELETIPCPTRNSLDEVATEVFYNNGWDLLHDFDIPKLITQGLRKWYDTLRPETVGSANRMLLQIGDLAIKRHQINTDVLNHHDARQANIAWHPDKGAAIVDWSWADKGMSDGDTTMFLLDLHKAGRNVEPYMNLFNLDYAKMIIGYWLQRSQTLHTEGNQKVRMQQFLSAIKASEIILNA